MGQPEGRRRQFDPFNVHHELRGKPALQQLTPIGTHLNHRSDSDNGNFTWTVRKAYTTTNEHEAPRSGALPRRDQSMRPV